MLPEDVVPTGWLLTVDAHNEGINVAPFRVSVGVIDGNSNPLVCWSSHVDQGLGWILKNLERTDL